jgi:hypothetical protein
MYRGVAWRPGADITALSNAVSLGDITVLSNAVSLGDITVLSNAVSLGDQLPTLLHCLTRCRLATSCRHYCTV